MNKVFLIGRLCADPELSTTASGVSICRFTLAVNRNYANSNGERLTDFLKCTAWRGQAESIAKYVKKGNQISVVGSVELRDYEDNNGIKRTAIDIVVSDCEFLTPKASEEAPTARKKPTLQACDDTDSDIPF